MNTRKIGEHLENYILFNLDMLKTKGSGSVKHDGDLKDNEDFVVECKYRSEKNLIIKKEWLNEIKKQADLSGRNWLIINQTDDKKIYVTLDFHVFVDLYDAFQNYKSAVNDKLL